ncbi:hypothetical protein AAFN60_14825 [Roseibacillus persicicus]|uniref:hypothetical protein n=1 Tax=Roseibacillus persicicus TaxID=454148 RepID=UPI00398AABB3
MLKAFTVLCLSVLSLAAEEAKRPIWVAAVGDPPVAKLKVVEEYGFRGYKPEEIDPKLQFPRQWSLSAGGASESLELKLNHPAIRLDLPASATSLELGLEGEATLNHFQLTSRPTLIVIYNPASDKSWRKGVEALAIPLEDRSGSALETTLLNLAPVSLHYLGSSGKPATLASHKWIPAKVPREKGSQVASLPILAKVEKREARLVVTDYRGVSSWKPVTVITPVFNAARPRLRSSVLYLQ